MRRLDDRIRNETVRCARAATGSSTLNHVTSSERPTTQPCSLRVCLLPPLLARLVFNPSFSTLVGTRSTPFYLQPSSPAYRAPNLMAEDSQIARITSAEIKPQKTAAPRSTRRLQPLTNLPSVWTTSSSGKGFTVYRFIQVTVRTFLCLSLLR